MRRLRWGILGTGNIARQFAEGLAASTRAELLAVGSRREESARAFVDWYAQQAPDATPPTAHADYAKLCQDPQVEAVYVALPNTLHAPWSIQALAQGKHVLCEKPLAANAHEAQAMIQAAQDHRRVLIEAFMYRCHPLIRAVRDELDSGAVGPLRLIRTSFCFNLRTKQGNIRFEPDLAGGALMDIGCYCLDFACLMAGAEPESVEVQARLHEPGSVDELASGTIRFPNGLLSSFVCGMVAQTDNAAYLCGEEGYISIPIPWKPPPTDAEAFVKGLPVPKQDRAKGVQPESPERLIRAGTGTPLYALEAEAFADTVLNHAAPSISLDESLRNMRWLDRMRRAVGVPIPAGETV